MDFLSLKCFIDEQVQVFHGRVCQIRDVRPTVGQQHDFISAECPCSDDVFFREFHAAFRLPAVSFEAVFMFRNSLKESQDDNLI